MQNFPNIPIDESQDVYSEIDNWYFPVGKTPKYMFVSFSGIRPGEKFPLVPVGHTPISGTFKIPHVGSTVWELWIDNLYLDFRIHPWWIYCAATYVIDLKWYYIFYSYFDLLPYFAGNNRYNVFENNYFFNGQFSASWFTYSDPNSIAQIADGIGFNRSKKAFYQGIPQSATESTYRFARRSDHSRILVKVDKSA